MAVDTADLAINPSHFVAKMPSERLSLSDISKPWMPNMITHELQPGEMVCNKKYEGCAHFPSVSSRPTTYREKVAPETFSHDVSHAGIGVISYAR